MGLESFAVTTGSPDWRGVVDARLAFWPLHVLCFVEEVIV